MINLDGALLGNLIQYINSPVFIAEKQNGGVISRCNMLMRNVIRRDRITLEDILSTSSLNKVLNAESGESVSVSINKEFLFNASLIDVIYSNRSIIVGLVRSTKRHQSLTENAVDLALQRGETPSLQQSLADHIKMTAIKEVEPILDADGDYDEYTPEVSIIRAALVKSIQPAIRLLNSSDSPLYELVQDLFAELASITDAHKGFLWRVVDSGSGLVMQQEYSWADLDFQDEDKYGNRTSLDNLEIKLNISLANAMMVGRAEVFTVSKMSEKIGAQFTKQGIKSFLLVPLMHKRNMVASVVLANCVDEVDWSDSQRDIANVVGSFLLTHVELAKALDAYGYYKERLDNSADAADMLVWEADTKLTFTYLSDNCELLTGYPSNELLGKDIKFLLSKYPENELLERSESNIIFKNIEKRLIKKDTTVKWMSSSGNCIYNDKNEVERVQGVTLDITESKNMAQNLRNAKFALENVNKQLVLTAKSASFLAEEANKASKAKSSFLANMSHEIRTPMNVILGMINVVKQTDLNDNQLDYLKKIDYAANVLLGVISDILDFSKIEAGKLEIELAEFSIENTLNNILGIMATQVHKKGVELLLYTSLDVPDIVIGDSLRLNQVLTNLLNNAIKFTDEGEIIVTAETQNVEDNRTYIKFSISDTGIGISKDYLNNMFVEFSQENISTTRQYGGTGLGLPLCKRIVELMGGKIWVESTLGQGATFYFTVPYSKPSQEFSYNLLDPSTYSELNVLVVDDSVASLNVLNRILNQLTISKVQMVSNADDAIESVKERLSNAEEQFDLILMDWSMPNKSGYMLLKEMNQIAKNTMPAVILLVTEYERSALNIQKIGGLVKSVLLKPITRTSLYDSIAEAFSPAEVEIVMPKKIDTSGSIVEGMNILLAEDNELNQLVAKEILERHGAILTIANNGKEAVDILNSADSDFDVILMDLQMPVLDGVEATRIINSYERFKDIPIIAMTAYSLDKEEKLSIGAKLDGFVSKPINQDDLFNEIARFRIKKVTEVHLQRVDKTLVDDDAHLGATLSTETLDGDISTDEPPLLDTVLLDGEEVEIELGKEFVPPDRDYGSNVLLETNSMDIFSSYAKEVEVEDFLPEQRFVVSDDEYSEKFQYTEKSTPIDTAALPDATPLEDDEWLDKFSVDDDRHKLDKIAASEPEVVDMLDELISPRGDDRYQGLTANGLAANGLATRDLTPDVSTQSVRTQDLRTKDTSATGVGESDAISDSTVATEEFEVDRRSSSDLPTFLPTLGEGADALPIKLKDQHSRVEPEADLSKHGTDDDADNEVSLPLYFDEDTSAVAQGSAFTAMDIGKDEGYDSTLLSGIGVDMETGSDDLSFMDTLNETIKDNEKRWIDNVEAAKKEDKGSDELLGQLDSLVALSGDSAVVNKQGDDAEDTATETDTIISEDLLERWASESDNLHTDDISTLSDDDEAAGADDFQSEVYAESEDIKQLLEDEKQVSASEIDEEELDEELADIVKQLDKKRASSTPNEDKSLVAFSMGSNRSIGRSRGQPLNTTAQPSRIKPNAGGLLGEVYSGSSGADTLLNGDMLHKVKEKDELQVEQPSTAKLSPFNTHVKRSVISSEDTFPAVLEGFDVQSGIERISGNASLYKIILHKLRDDLPFMMDKLKYAIDSNENDDILSYLHNLKGILGNVSAVNSYRIVTELEAAYSQNSDGTADLLTKFDEAMEIVKRSLNSI